jgi:hypothetical protein
MRSTTTVHIVPQYVLLLLLLLLPFYNYGPRSPLKQQPSTDHLGPLLIPAGHDSYSSIGLPHSSSSSSSSWDAASVAAGQQQWLDAVGRVWKGSTAAGAKQQQQQQQGGHGSSTVAFSATYLEDGEWRQGVWGELCMFILGN